ncbi:hypothetical protein V8C43DRAFT_284805 [Trichoderma afarasin]
MYMYTYTVSHRVLLLSSRAMSAFFGTSILRDGVCLALESDFSIVGGMSLSLVALQDAIRRNMLVDLSVRDTYSRSTLGSIARLASNGADNTPLEHFGPMRRPFLQA